MSDSGKTGWPTNPLGFLPFTLPGLGAGSGPSPMDSGLDAFRSMWSQIPGSSQVPGFLVPTTDLAELDKRLSDLRAAEQWVEVNLNLLRATIQGLEVQRNTIAALRSLSAMPAAAAAAPEAPSATDTATLAASDWLAQLQAQFSKVAEAALAPSTPAKPARKRARAKTKGAA